MLEIGTVTRPHGVKGEVVVELITNRSERVAPAAELQGSAGPLVVERSHPLAPAGGRERHVVKFRGIGTRDEAETLRGTVLRAPELQDDATLWVHELIDCSVVDSEGQALGTVRSVEANPASDLLVLESGMLIPLRFVTDASPGQLTVDLPPGLLEL